MYTNVIQIKTELNVIVHDLATTSLKVAFSIHASIKTVRLTVTCGVNMIRELGNCHLKPQLDGGHDLLVAVRGHKCNREAFRPETSSSSVEI